MTSFLKMHGLGNDFVVFDARRTHLTLAPSEARALADRRRGIGCDQVISIEPGKNGADAFMRIWNADGAEVESCGNATRCVARLLMEERDRDRVRIDTPGGSLLCSDAGGGLVSVDMGAPRLGWREIPLAREVDTASFALNVEGVNEAALNSVSALSVGNPHCVLFVADAEAAPARMLGPKLETHAMFPERTNVEFVSKLGTDRLRMCVWERGAGVTLACGTGACAAAAAAHRRGLVGRKVEVVLDGGALSIELRQSDEHIVMTGPTALAFRGEVDLAALIA